MTVRFASKINIILNENDFNDLVKTRSGAEACYPWSDKTRVFTDEYGFTQGIKECNAGGLITPTWATIFHFRTHEFWWDQNGKVRSKEAFEAQEKKQSDGEYKDECIFPQNYQAVLHRDHAHLTQSGPAIRGLLTGGTSWCRPSHHLKCYLKETYNALKLPFTLLWGGELSKAIHYSRPRDTWTILVKGLTMPDLRLTKKPFLQLYRLFSEIAVDPGDTLYLDGKKIPKADLAEGNLIKSSQPEAPTA